MSYKTCHISHIKYHISYKIYHIPYTRYVLSCLHVSPSEHTFFFNESVSYDTCPRGGDTACYDTDPRKKIAPLKRIQVFPPCNFLEMVQSSSIYFVAHFSGANAMK